VQRASDCTVIPKFLLAGEHGAGKTHCMATADEPGGDGSGLFAAVFEGNQSKSTIRSVNPKATVFEVKTVADWRELYSAIVGGELDDFKFFGVDSLNEMQAYYDRDYEDRQKLIQKEEERKGGKKPVAQPPKENKWAKLREMKSRMSNVFVFLRDIPLPVAATIRTRTIVEDDTGNSRVQFNLEGAARDNVGAYFTGTTYIYKSDGGSAGENVRHALFSGPDNFPCREMECLRGICEPNIRLWMEALEAHGAGRELPSGLYHPDARMPGERATRGRSSSNSI